MRTLKILRASKCWSVGIIFAKLLKILDWQDKAENYIAKYGIMI